MEGNIDISDMLPERDKKDKEGEEKDEDSLPHFDVKIRVRRQKIKEQEERKKLAKFFILKGFFKPFRLLTQLVMFNHLTILFIIFVSLAICSFSTRKSFE